MSMPPEAVEIVGLEECQPHTTVCQQKEKKETTIILKTEHVKSWRQNRLGQKEGRLHHSDACPY